MEDKCKAFAFIEKRLAVAVDSSYPAGSNSLFLCTLQRLVDDILSKEQVIRDQSLCCWGSHPSSRPGRSSDVVLSKVCERPHLEM